MATGGQKSSCRQGSVSGSLAWLCTLQLSVGTEQVGRVAAGAVGVGVPKDGLQL